MIFRLSTKLAAKLKVKPSGALPLDPNPFVDWSAHLFTADRSQFVIVTNTASLYSTVFSGRGIASDNQFVEQTLNCLREFMAVDGQELIFQRFIAPACATAQFSKALSRSVTGSMNDLIVHAKMWLAEWELSPHETALRLNDIPFSSLKYQKPREVFTGMEPLEVKRMTCMALNPGHIIGKRRNLERECTLGLVITGAKRKPPKGG